MTRAVLHFLQTSSQWFSCRFAVKEEFNTEPQKHGENRNKKFCSCSLLVYEFQRFFAPYTLDLRPENWFTEHW
jgi:hypothetical protein